MLATVLLRLLLSDVQFLLLLFVVLVVGDLLFDFAVVVVGFFYSLACGRRSL